MNRSDINFVVSGREIGKEKIMQSMRLWDEYITSYFRTGRVSGVYSSTNDDSPLYGGRQTLQKYVINDENIQSLNKNNIGFMMTLTNHNFSEEAYKQTTPILEKIENNLNSVVVTNDQLAKAIRKDFPLLTIKASVIKLLTNYNDIDKALTLYDYITIPPWMNDDEEFLRGIKVKDRMIIFANSNCLYNCRIPTCYEHIANRIFANIITDEPACRKTKAKKHKKENGTFVHKDTHVFDIHEPRFQGFSNFKLVPVNFEQVLSYNYIQEKYNKG